MQVNTPIQFLSGTKSNKPKLILQKNDNVDYIVCESNEGCWGNGICDPILNIAKYCYDGDDCNYVKKFDTSSRWINFCLLIKNKFFHELQSKNLVDTSLNIS